VLLYLKVKLMTEITIKKVSGELTIVTPGLFVTTMLTSKKDINIALETSLAHQWLVCRAANHKKTSYTSSGAIPSIDASNPAEQVFFLTVKLVIEQLVNLDNWSIYDACLAGNNLLIGNPPVSDRQVIRWAISDSLRYGRALGKF
jgi:hypothetical protein